MTNGLYFTLMTLTHLTRSPQGVTSFDFCRALSLLVTGGLDPAVRLWNRYVVSQPVAALHGHGTTVLDVAIHQTLNKIFSYSRDAVRAAGTERISYMGFHRGGRGGLVRSFIQSIKYLTTLLYPFTHQYTHPSISSSINVPFVHISKS